jgi:hypothetical protein
MREAAMRRLLRWVGVLGGILSVEGQAQTNPGQTHGRWALGISRSVSSLSAGSVGPSEDGVEIGWAPYRPSLWGLTAAYGTRTRVSITARYGKAGLGARGETLSDENGAVARALIVNEGVYDILSVGATVSRHLLRLRGGPALRSSLGAEIESWSALGESPRTIAGVQGGLALEVAIVGPFEAALEGELGFTPASPFKREEMPDNYRLRSTWRRTLGGAIYWRF